MSEKDAMPGGAQLLVRYETITSLRALVQAIPVVGGSVDTLLAGHGSKLRARRLTEFLSALEQRLRSVEVGKPNEEQSEALHDLVIQTIEAVVRSRSSQKRERFANLVARQLIEQRPAEESEAAQRLLEQIDELHLRVLMLAAAAPICSDVFEGLRVVTLVVSKDDPKRTVPPLYLWEALPEYSGAVLRMACAELVARGLLYDEGVGRMDTKALEFFVITDLGRWFLEWVSRSDK